MQLMPATAARFGVRDVNDPEENIRAGTEYLSFLNHRYGGDLDKTLVDGLLSVGVGWMIGGH